MKRVAAALVLVLSPVTLLAGEPAADTAWVDQSRQLAMQLGGQLKAELSKAIAEGGPMAAINVCYLRAPEIAAQLSQASGARVGRTALRVRNPSNAPDDLERTVLEQFAADLGSGPIDRPLEAVFEIRRGDAVERRYMRAIPTDALCLTCHGQSIAPELAAAIARDYPKDQATGFEQGQLRGAFSVVWPAPSPPPNP
jgi:cytochrome c-type biogenesis protein CcmH/NrfF